MTISLDPKQLELITKKLDEVQAVMQAIVDELKKANDKKV